MAEFDYKITSKNQVTVITFSGKISRESKQQLETCREQMAPEGAKMIIIYFKDVSTVEPCVFREFTLLQQDIRKKNIELYLAGLDNKVKDYLVERAVIRAGEVRKNLTDILDEKKKSI